MTVKRIAYFVGEFPSKSMTWIWNEILALLDEGYVIKVFSRDKESVSLEIENHAIIKNTTYRSTFFYLSGLKNPIKSIQEFVRIVLAIWNDFFNDTNGIRGKFQILKDLLFFLSISDEIQTFKPDLVVVHFANATSNPVLFNHIVHKTPYIIKMHAIDVYRRTNLFRMKTALACKVLTISNFNIEFLRKRDSDIDLSKFIIHRCGIPLDAYQFRPMLIAHNKIPIILSVGRLVRVKGFDVLINASAELHNKKIAHKIVIIGYGPEKTALINLVDQKGIKDNVEFMDYCPPEKVKEVLQSSDLFVLASKYDEVEIQEGVPVSIMEAMSVGLPVISTRIGGIPELIEDKKTGFLVEPNDPRELSQKIEELLKMPVAQLKIVVENARVKMEKEFNLKVLNEELVKVFEEINN